MGVHVSNLVISHQPMQNTKFGFDDCGCCNSKKGARLSLLFLLHCSMQKRPKNRFVESILNSYFQKSYWECGYLFHYLQFVTTHLRWWIHQHWISIIIFQWTYLLNFTTALFTSLQLILYIRLSKNGIIIHFKQKKKSWYFTNIRRGNSWLIHTRHF